MRALKRRLSDVVYRQMVNDAKRLETGAREDMRQRRSNPARLTSAP